MTVEEYVVRESASGKDFSRNLKTLRVMRGLDQQELAEKIGRTRSTVSLLETGKQKPHRSTVKRLAEALDVPENVLAG